ncbi:MAG TPA: glycoside hydrolase family 88 protein [Opitutus sp.]|nr:glycoside hydrolase family 88 protein [Opitutus sp.]
MPRLTLVLTALSLGCTGSICTAEPMAAPAPNRDAPLAAADVLAVAQRAADWQWAHLPDPKDRDPRGWEIAPFYLGTLALDRIAPGRGYRDLMIRQADSMHWQPGDRLYHADDHCVIQAYLELYAIAHEPRMLERSRRRLDEILAHPSTASYDWGAPGCQEHWTWCDALFMGPMSWLLMWRQTGDRRYLDFMDREWWRTTDRLYDRDVGFFFRDASFFKQREPNGKTIHWARGNGWVFAGLARVLALFPKDHPDYPRYVALYRQMAAAILAAQQPDGLWRVGLLDPVAHPAPETSGTSFLAFGLAWGVNHDLLDRAAVTPAIRRAWRALAACVAPDGKLEHVQPIGSGPVTFDPHHTDTFAVGAFLLAAAEVHDLAAAHPGAD